MFFFFLKKIEMMNNSINHHNYLLKVILIFIDLLLFLDYFKFLVSGQLLDICNPSSIVINDRLYFFGGSFLFAKSTNQIIYLNLSKSFPLNHLPPIKLLTPTSTAPVPPFYSASLALGGSNNDILYLIS